MATLNNVTKGQFMRRDASYSTRPSRTGVNLLGWEEEESLSPEEKRDCLVSKSKSLQNQIIATPKSDPSRKQIIKLKMEVDKKIHQIRPKKKCPGVEKHFLDVARETLTKFEFDRWMDEASRRRRLELNNA